MSNAVRATPGRLDPDRLARLEEERDHLLRSLQDIDAEHAAGDLDEHDYEELKDDYTVRAADVIRAIEEHHDLVERSRPERSWRRTALVVGGVLVFAVAAGVLLARSSGQRGAGTITGNGDSLREQLASCQMLSLQKPAEGITCYEPILKTSPDNLEALTYQGWAYIRDGQVERGAKNLARVVELDPDYPDVRVFRAIALTRAATSAAKAGDSTTARESFLAAAAELDRFYRNDPPQVAVQVLVSRASSARSSSGSSRRRSSTAGRRRRRAALRRRGSTSPSSTASEPVSTRCWSPNPPRPTPSSRRP